MTKKVVLISLASIILIGIIGYWIIGNPIVLINNQKLGNAIKSINTQSIQINDIVPFEWDTLYTFTPYTSKEEIAQIIGFKSNEIKENNINEGMVHLLFVKGNKVVASILGYGRNLGYRIDFPNKVEYKENAQFNVTNVEDVITLAYAK